MIWATKGSKYSYIQWHFVLTIKRDKHHSCAVREPISTTNSNSAIWRKSIKMNFFPKRIPGSSALLGCYPHVPQVLLVKIFLTWRDCFGVGFINWVQKRIRGRVESRKQRCAKSRVIINAYLQAIFDILALSKESSTKVRLLREIVEKRGNRGTLFLILY